MQPDFHAADRSMWSPEIVRQQIEDARLLLWNDGKTAQWRYAWEVPTLDASGMAYRIVMDAGTGEVLELESTAVDHTCSPSSNSNEAATGNPQNPSIPNQSLWATPASDRGPAFVAEAHRASTYGVPDIQIFHGATSKMCNNGYFELLPLPEGADGKPLYDGASGNTYPGSVAGDAIRFTYKTMQTLHSLGRNGWDGAGGPAPVVVDAHYPVTWGDAANFHRTADVYAPANSVAILRSIRRPYTMAAAIDIIGHEWGHGVIYTSANFPYDPNQYPDVGGQLHEGFADVIGYITELSNQPQGSGPEKADWKAGEDSFGNGEWDRCVDNAVWPPWLPSWEHYYFHKNDHASDWEAHNRGNMLPVAFRLLDVGGKNPICSRPGWSGEGCTISVNGQGFSKARQIFFYTLTHYCTSTTQWEDLPNLMMLAAYHLYKNCPIGHPGDPALAEQEAVNDAFTAIGYPGSGYYECPN